VASFTLTIRTRSRRASGSVSDPWSGPGFAAGHSPDSTVGTGPSAKFSGGVERGTTPSVLLFGGGWFAFSFAPFYSFDFGFYGFSISAWDLGTPWWRVGEGSWAAFAAIAAAVTAVVSIVGHRLALLGASMAVALLGCQVAKHHDHFGWGFYGSFACAVGLWLSCLRLVVSEGIRAR